MTKEGSPYHELHEEKFPAENEIREFIQYYMISNKPGPLGKEDEDKLVIDPSLLKEYQNNLFSSEEEWQARHEDLIEQMKAGVFVSAYYCTMVSVILGRNYSKEMDTLQFASDNFVFYKKFRAQVSA